MLEGNEMVIPADLMDEYRRNVVNKWAELVTKGYKLGDSEVVIRTRAFLVPFIQALGVERRTLEVNRLYVLKRLAQSLEGSMPKQWYEIVVPDEQALIVATNRAFDTGKE